MTREERLRFFTDEELQNLFNAFARAREENGKPPPSPRELEEFYVAIVASRMESTMIDLVSEGSTTYAIDLVDGKLMLYGGD